MRTLFMITSLLLAACSPTYHDMLAIKLEGRSDQEKRTILAQECRKEIAAGLKPEDAASVRHFERMRKICEEMTGQKISLNTPDDQ